MLSGSIGQNSEVSSANKYGVVSRSSTRSLTYAKNSKGPKIEPCGTEAFMAFSSIDSYYMFASDMSRGVLL